MAVGLMVILAGSSAVVSPVLLRLLLPWKPPHRNHRVLDVDEIVEPRAELHSLVAARPGRPTRKYFKTYAPSVGASGCLQTKQWISRSAWLASAFTSTSPARRPRLVKVRSIATVFTMSAA